MLTVPSWLGVTNKLAGSIELDESTIGTVTSFVGDVPMLKVLFSASSLSASSTW